jgi:hypothetical protein
MMPGMTRLPLLSAADGRPLAALLLAVLTALCATLIAPGAAHAQRLSITPTPGLWETRQKLELNGVDFLEVARRLQDDALAQLSGPARAEAEQLMKEQAALLSGIERECISAEDAAAMADARRMVERMNAGESGEETGCRFELVSARGATLNLRGRCEATDGWEGDLQGTLTLADAKNWTMRFTGTGRLKGERLPGVPDADGAVTSVMETKARWLGASCGNVPRRQE